MKQSKFNIFSHRKKIKIWLDLAKEGDKLSLNEEQGYNRYLIYSNIPQVVNDVKITKNPDSQSNLIITKVKFNETERLNEIYEKEGPFQKISSIILNSKKPIVGHNCLLDVFYLYQHFHKNLPSTVEEFKSNFNSLFPIIYDTKTLAYNDRYLDTILSKNDRHLEKLYKTIMENENNYRTPRIDCKELDLNSPKQAHDAGYDAFMTGYIFLKFACQISHENTIFTNESMKIYYENRLNMMRFPTPFSFNKK